MKKLLSLSAFVVSAVFGMGTAYAVCPVCTLAVAAGVGLSRWLGIDDTISGVWIGGLVVSLIMWTIRWFNQKHIHFRGRDVLTVLVYYALIVLPFAWMDVIGNKFNMLWGVDKLFLGITLGSVGFFVGARSYMNLKERRGRAHFPFQKVLMPLLPLVLLSILFYLVTTS